MKIKYKNIFEQDAKRAKKRGLNMDRLKAIIHLLAEGTPYPLATEIIRLSETIKATENVTFNQIGYSFTNENQAFLF